MVELRYAAHTHSRSYTSGAKLSLMALCCGAIIYSIKYLKKAKFIRKISIQTYTSDTVLTEISKAAIKMFLASLLWSCHVVRPWSTVNGLTTVIKLISGFGIHISHKKTALFCDRSLV